MVLLAKIHAQLIIYILDIKEYQRKDMYLVSMIMKYQNRKIDRKIQKRHTVKETSQSPYKQGSNFSLNQAFKLFRLNAVIPKTHTYTKSSKQHNLDSMHLQVYKSFIFARFLQLEHLYGLIKNVVNSNQLRFTCLPSTAHIPAICRIRTRN